MLVLTRGVGEALLIGRDVRVVVLEVEGRKVRLGFVAPDGTSILREELLQQQPPREKDSGK